MRYLEQVALPWVLKGECSVALRTPAVAPSGQDPVYRHLEGKYIREISFWAQVGDL